MKKRTKLLTLSKWLFMLCITLLVLAGMKTKAQAVTKYDLWIGPTQITSENCNDLSDIVVGSFARKTHSYFDPDTNTLYLDDVLRIDGNTMHNGTRSKIYSKLPLKIRGSAELYCMEDNTTAISTESYLDIQGNFSFEGFSGGLFAGQRINIDGEATKITIKKQSSADSSAIHGLFGVCVNDGSITIDEYSQGIYSPWGDVCLFGGSYNITCNSGGLAVVAKKDGLTLVYGCEINEPKYGRVENYYFSGLGGNYATIVKQNHKEGQQDHQYSSTLKLYLRQEKLCYVTYDTNEKLDFNSKQTHWSGRPKGSTFDPPADPTRDGYFFGGWYTSRDCRDGEEFDFNTKVDRSITLYAKWNKGQQYNLWVDGTRVTDVNKDDIPVNANGRVSFDPASNTLKLDGWFGVYEYTPTVNKVKAFIYTGIPLNITGDTDIVTYQPDAYPIYSYLANITIAGNIRIEGGNTGIFSALGVKVDGANTQLTIKNSETGIFGGSGVAINNGKVDINAKTYGLKTNAGLIDIQGGLSTIKANQCAIYGGTSKNVNVADKVAITEPENYKIDKTTSGGASYYTIMNSDSKAAKTVTFDTSRPIYTITFDVNGKDVKAPQAQQIADGRYAHYPNVSEPKGFKFGGWHVDAACTQRYEFTTPVHSSFTLYAKWNEKEEGPALNPDRVSSGRLPHGRGSLLNFKRGQRFRVVSDDKDNPTVTFERLTDKKATRVTVPKSITVDDVTYKVTAVSAGAFKGCKKLTTVTLGANIESIGNNAFKGCSSLKTVKIQSAKLTKKSVSSKAFKGINANATIKIPAKMKKSYSKFFTKKGLSKSVKIK